MKILATLCLLLASPTFASTTGSPRLPTPPLTGKASAETGDFSSRRYVYVSPEYRSPWNGAFELCASWGARLPNGRELPPMVTESRLGKEYAGRAFWSATRNYTYDRPYFAVTRTDGESWWNAPWVENNVVCHLPADPVKEMREMCPVGRMEYLDGRFICGNFAQAFSRCLQSLMGRKSWQMVTVCRPTRSQFWRTLFGSPLRLASSVVDAASRIHSTNLVPLPGSGGNLRYCAIDPQHVEEGFELADENCFEAPYRASGPSIPYWFAERNRELLSAGACPAGNPLTVLLFRAGQTWSGLYPNYIGDYALEEQLQNLTGINVQHLRYP